ncbi:MAG TPA: alpha/beta hydrolase [Blastocatellia bacterium]|nr:alpha/beta hydrolase [Blastocatellia bacterium]
MKRIVITVVVALLFSLQALAADSDLDKRVEHGYANSSGVKIHYASLGSKDKPLIVMIHGFPDFWYTWRDQMEALSKDYQVVAIDQRGYNLSDKPKGVENYDVRFLVGDVAAVIKHLGREKAIVIGHDWGGMVAWETRCRCPTSSTNLSSSTFLILAESLASWRRIPNNRRTASTRATFKRKMRLRR